jgi:DNA-binding CsgD family transcriptional regulator
MSKATFRAVNKISPGPGQDDAPLEDLIRSILATGLCGGAAPVLTDGDGEQVVFDIDCDGDRYILIRMPHVERKPLKLSPREREIVRMVAQGHQNKIIAAVLNISSWTVCTHLRRIFAKLGVSSRAAMVARLADFGGVPEPKANLEDGTLPRGAHSIVAAGELHPQQGSIGSQFRPDSTQSTVRSTVPAPYCRLGRSRSTG